MRDNTPEGKSERTKRYIIEKVSPLFNMKGYAGTSLSDMTRATGLTKGSIYGNFMNKDEVALRAFDHGIGRIIDAISDEMARQSTCLDKLLAYPKVYRALRDDILATGGCPLANTLTDADDTHQALRKAATGILVYWRKTVSRLIEKGIRAGEFRHDADPVKTALSIITIIEGSSVLAKGTGSVEYYANGIDAVEELILSLKKQHPEDVTHDER
ncbi:MAG TPA: TetR/AcrR family transcriptional regulator [Spirochaetota bacterium]|mgnify:CR=1 FL=1|nr:TetR/AcrR family transcriptional regulator [Spirochaetota bacterium]HPV39878.1 TetR/AcrR family transcriptional regulator [Spirochaetota bacterium]